MGYVRPVLDYGMAAWSTTSKNNQMKIKRVQNQATRIITGGMKSTPILALETITGLDDFETDVIEEYYSNYINIYAYLITLCTKN